MPNLVIVAVPDENDYVHRISSEKVAHMTILFLGDMDQISDLSMIIGFVKHAADISLTKFGMEVDHRGKLGIDEADVLFFAKSKWSGYGDLNTFRSNLLKNDAIRTAYDSPLVQFPEWIPHLTLGYPESPAKPDNRDYPGITYVSFDRIAVWFEDFNGVEIPLQSHNWDVDMAMSVDDVVKELVLEHHGVKGMHWGVRGSGRPSRSERRAGKQEKKADKKWEKNMNSIESHIKVHNLSADKFNAKIGAYNNKWEGVDLTDEHSAARAKYDKGAFRLMNETHAEAFNEIHGTSPSGKFKVHAWVNADGEEMVASGPVDYVNKTLRENKVKHGMHDDAEGIIYQIFRDVDGLITKVEPVIDTIAQGVLVVGDILEHHGVKGMHWGVRRSTGAATQTVKTRRAQARSPEVTVRERGKKLKTSGGRGLSAHPDAISARSIGQKGKGSGLKALSDKELKDYANRLQLEQNVHRLNHNQKNAGARFVSGLIKTQGSRAARSGAEAAGTLAGKSALKIAVKKSAKIAAVAAV